LSLGLLQNARLNYTGTLDVGMMNRRIDEGVDASAVER
jgi:hypothetical protein